MSQQMQPLDPATIDEYIEATRTTRQTQADADAQLVRSLHGAYALPAATRTAVMERVHERLRSEMINPSSSVGTTARTEGSVLRAVEPRVGSPGRRNGSPLGRVRSAFGALAAVLVVALLAGAFYAVTQGHVKKHGAGPTATVTQNATLGPIGVWQDVAISSANTGGKLDFDPNKGVAYSVATSTGTVYVCGGGHLWYSQDGGAHYRPFAPALPSSFASGITGACTMTTVQGWPGLFIAQSNNPDGRSVLYAAPDDGSWQKLLMSGVALPAGGGGSHGQVVIGGDIWSDLFNSANYESLTPAVQASGDWLFFTGMGGGSPDLVGTLDFGQTWVDVSAAYTGNPCTHFAVSPNNHFYLACQPSSAGGVSESVDGGKTWTSLGGGIGSSLYLVGMSDHTIYATYANPAYTAHVVTSDVKTGVWNDQGSVYAVNMGGPETVTPDGAVFFPVLDDKTASQLSVYTYSPGSHGLKQVLGSTASPGTKGGIREFGGLWPNMAPAVYSFQTPAITGPTSAYRLFLPSPASGTTLPTPTATTPASPTPIGNVACTQAQGDPASIQSGGVGANMSTLSTRWGGTDGAGLGSLYFGRMSDGRPQAQAPDGYSRAYGLIYNVDPAKKTTLPDATALAKTILPTDATALTPLQDTVNAQSGHEEMTQLYCSAAYLAVAPTSQQGPLLVPRNGVIKVTYVLGQVGNVQSIAFWPVQ